MSSGSLYHHFPGGKEELTAASSQFAADLVSSMLGRMLDEHDALTALRQWLDTYAAALRRDPRDGCPVAPVAIEAVASSPTLREVAGRAFDAWTARLAERLVHDGHSPGAARGMALTVLSAIEGALLIDRTRTDGAALAAIRDRLPALLAPQG